MTGVLDAYLVDPMVSLLDKTRIQTQVLRCATGRGNCSPSHRHPCNRHAIAQGRASERPDARMGSADRRNRPRRAGRRRHMTLLAGAHVAEVARAILQACGETNRPES
jgi:hypothetical protein